MKGHGFRWSVVSESASPRGGHFRKGDYWIIPARVMRGDVEWPSQSDGRPNPIPPQGIKHHRAGLATVKKDPINWKETACGCQLFPLCKP